MLSASRFVSRFVENQSARKSFSTLLKNVSRVFQFPFFLLWNCANKAIDL